MSRKDKTPWLLKLVRWVFPRLERVAPSLAHKRPFKEDEFVESAGKSFLQVNQKRIQVYAWGKPEHPAVWVVHGWAGRATQFRKFIPALTTAGYRVVGFDGPAHGLSEGRQTNILEFEEIFKQLAGKIGEPAAVITHSFGGVAVLYSMANGWPVQRLINIASPTIGNEVINTYLRAINGSPSTGQAFQKWMIKTYGKSFDEFSGIHLIQHLPSPVKLLLIYDENDEEVTINHADAMLEVYPQAKLIKTNGLGHNRILKEDAVISACIGFIKSVE
jgi:pimeloyl-ACP methyl ester carboxylesterase